MIIERVIQLNAADIAVRMAAEDVLISAGSAAHDALFEAGRSDETERRWHTPAGWASDGFLSNPCPP